MWWSRYQCDGVGTVWCHDSYVQDHAIFSLPNKQNLIWIVSCMSHHTWQAKHLLSNLPWEAWPDSKVNIRPEQGGLMLHMCTRTTHMAYTHIPNTHGCISTPPHTHTHTCTHILISFMVVWCGGVNIKPNQPPHRPMPYYLNEWEHKYSNESNWVTSEIIRRQIGDKSFVPCIVRQWFTNHLTLCK